MNQKKIEGNNDSLPYSFFAEQGILNILLTTGKTKNILQENLPNLKKNTFYHEPHRLIYETILELWENNSLINLTTVITKLEDSGKLKKIGGVEKIGLIIKQAETISNLEEYIKIVNEKYLRRLIVEFGKQSIRFGYSTSFSVEEIIGKIEYSLQTLHQEKTEEKIQSAAQIVDEIYEEMKNKKENNSQSGFISSFKDFDAIIQGFQKSDLIIIAGRPSMGKTAFSLHLGKNIVEKYEIPLLIFTLEMSRQQIIYRLISNESNINNSRLKSGKMTSDELLELKKAMKKISKMPIFIDDNPNITINDIRSKIKKVFFDNNQTGIVIIDYLQLMKLSSKLENRVQEISYLTRSLKLLAKELNIPIILLSQLSRNVESRVNKRPMLSDLRESGCLTKLFIKKIKNIESWNLKERIFLGNNSFQFKGIKPTYLVTFENDTEIALSANHKILSEKGWIRVSEFDFQTKICLCNEKKGVKEKFIKLKKIEYMGIHSVFDQNIPRFHNYIYKDLILHNSIEQDADIVIMLYREDYYNDKLHSPITEFIVAKHRNGPIGTGHLLFNPSINSFSNVISSKH